MARFIRGGAQADKGDIGMSDKYIIRNCPAISFTVGCLNEEVKVWDCRDCTGCILKQIVELCKEDLKPVREWQEGDTVFIEYKKDAHLANNILQLLQIKEVE